MRGPLPPLLLLLPLPLLPPSLLPPPPPRGAPTISSAPNRTLRAESGPAAPARPPASARPRRWPNDVKSAGPVAAPEPSPGRHRHFDRM